MLWRIYDYEEYRQVSVRYPPHSRGIPNRIFNVIVNFILGGGFCRSILCNYLDNACFFLPVNIHVASINFYLVLKKVIFFFIFSLLRHIFFFKTVKFHLWLYSHRNQNTFNFVPAYRTFTRYVFKIIHKLNWFVCE